MSCHAVVGNRPLDWEVCGGFIAVLLGLMIPQGGLAVDFIFPIISQVRKEEVDAGRKNWHSPAS
jgi:hypothetical protein